MGRSDEGNWGPGIIGLAATCEALVLIFVILRVYTRVWIARSFWWDDFTIILAVLGTTIGCALCFVEVHYGFGKHFQFLDEHEKREFRKYTFGEWIQTFATLMWTKISICLFLIRIPNSKRLRTAMYWCVAFLLFSNTILTTMWIMACQPVHTQWYGEGICMSRFEKEAIIMTQAIISIVSDFLFAGFPIFYFWRLQVDMKTKIGLWVIMCLGCITGACCIVRTVLNGESIPDDETYDGIVNWTWRLFEVQFGIIAACIPTLRPLYSRVSAFIRGDRAPVADGNIKFLSAEKAQANRWIEHKEDRKHGKGGKRGGDHSPDDFANGHPSEPKTRKHTIRLPGTEPKHTEDMRQDLINEGIISKGGAHTGTAGRDRSEPERNTSAAGLQNEMHMYGIPDEFSEVGGSSLSPSKTNTAVQSKFNTPQPTQEGFEDRTVEETPVPCFERKVSGAVAMGSTNPSRNPSFAPPASGNDPSSSMDASSPSSPQGQTNPSLPTYSKQARIHPSDSPSTPPSPGSDPRPHSYQGFEWFDLERGRGDFSFACDDPPPPPVSSDARSGSSGSGSGSGRGRSASNGGGQPAHLQDALDEDEGVGEGGVGPMQAAREWEPGQAV